MKTILCLSGGLDSLAAYYYLGKPKTIYFHCSEYSCKEEKIIKKLVPETIIDTSLNFTGRAIGQNAYIPYRNLLFALQAAKYGEEIVIAGIKDDMVSDKSPSAFNLMAFMMNQLDSKLTLISSPFWNWTKEDIVGFLLDQPDGEKLIRTSTSCYHPTETYCGACPSCFRKACALWNRGVHLEWNEISIMLEYLDRARAGHYIPERNASIIKFVIEYLDGSKPGTKLDSIQKDYKKLEELRKQWGKLK